MLTNTERRTVTVEEAAKILGIGRASAYLAIKTGDLPYLKIGRRIVVSRIALERMLEGGALAGQADEAH